MGTLSIFYMPLGLQVFLFTPWLLRANTDRMNTPSSQLRGFLKLVLSQPRPGTAASRLLPIHSIAPVAAVRVRNTAAAVENLCPSCMFRNTNNKNTRLAHQHLLHCLYTLAIIIGTFLSVILSSYWEGTAR